MDSGLLYVVFNTWIKNPETQVTPYKIGITRRSVDDRYYGLGLKMPGKFETKFAYKLDDCAEAEHLIHGILDKFHENGEWFNVTQKELDLIKTICETMGGKEVTNDVVNEIEAETEAEIDDEMDDEMDDDFDGTETDADAEDETDKNIDREESINIKGINIPLYRNNKEITQDFVKKVLYLMFNNKLLPESEIQNLLNKKYSVKTFGIPVSMLQNDKRKLNDRKGHGRYWKKETFGEKYYACSQWWKENDDIYTSKLAKWIKKIAELNSK